MVDFNSTTPMTIVNVIGVNIGTVKSYEVRRPKYILYTRNYQRASLIAQLVKNTPAMQETLV